MKAVLSTAKTHEGKAFVQDIDTLQRVYAWTISTIFNATPGNVVFSVAEQRNGSKAVYCKYTASLQRQADPAKTAILAEVSPRTLGDKKQVLEVIAFVCLHALFLKEGKQLPRKKPRAFRELAEKFGFTAEKSDDPNAGFETVRFTDGLWKKVEPATAGLAFNFEAIPATASKSTQRKTVYTYISPDRRDVVKSHNPQLNIWAKMGRDFKQWEIATPAMLEERKSLLAQERAKRPRPEARGKTLA